MTPLKIELDDKAVARVDKHLATLKADHAAALEKFQGIDIGQAIAFLAKICAAYAVAKPIIDFVKKYLLLWKPSWKKAIDGVQSAVEAACSLTPQP